ncbi:MAG: Adenylate cyclase 1 [Pseudomonadota bacterium]|jgi:adenylate cyclase
MPNVHVEPEKRVVQAEESRSLLDALKQAGIDITHACGGRARCSTCRVAVVEGLERCEARNEAEEAMARKLSLGDDIRLACQTRVTGEVAVRRLVLDEVDLKLASQRVALGAAVGRDAELAVMFSDVANFTPFSEALTAYDVVHTLDRWFTVSGDVVERHGGRVDNYMGDGFLAVFEDAERAVDAGLALADAAAGLSRYTQGAFSLPFSTRMGIHWGSVVVGTLGASHNRRSTTMGDVVNMAARIEAANKELGTTLLVSSDVEARLGDRFARGRRAELALKGKSGVHALVEILPPPG